MLNKYSSIPVYAAAFSAAKVRSFFLTTKRIGNKKATLNRMALNILFIKI
jgi:hypothetical protein